MLVPVVVVVVVVEDDVLQPLVPVVVVVVVVEDDVLQERSSAQDLGQLYEGAERVSPAGPWWSRGDKNRLLHLGGRGGGL